MHFFSEHCAENEISRSSETLDKLLEDSLQSNHGLVVGDHAVRQMHDSFSEAPELDNILEQNILREEDSKRKLQHNSNKILSDTANNAKTLVTSQLVPSPTLLTTIPHLKYSLLHEYTQGFADCSFDEGGRKLGEGAFGVVYRADIPSKYLNEESTDNGDVLRQLAIKKLNFSDDRVDSQFKVEIETMSKCKHPYILSLEGYSCDGPAWCIVYKFMVNGNLQDRLALLRDTPPLTPLQRLTIAHSVAQGIAYLHTFLVKPLVHRDIKSANILLDSQLSPRVGDFGLLRTGGSGSSTRTMIQTTTVYGTSAYMAPEAFRGDVSVKLDTFSYGVVLLEILTGLPPHDDNREGRDLLSHIEESDDPPSVLCDSKAGDWPQGMPEAFHQLALLCSEEKKKRPTMVDVVEKWKPYLEKWTDM